METIRSVTTEQAYSIITAEPGKIIGIASFLDRIVCIDINDWYRTYIDVDVKWDVSILSCTIIIDMCKNDDN